MKRRKIRWWLVGCLFLLLPALTLPAAAEAETEAVAETQTETETVTVTDGEGSLEVWFGTSVLPTLVSTVVVIGTAMLELIPAVRSLGRAKRHFETVAERADAYTQEKIAYDERSAARELELQQTADALRTEAEERLQRWEERWMSCVQEQEQSVRQIAAQASEYRAALDACEARLTELIERTNAGTARTERMVFLGMTNAGELVTNGTARRIAEVEEETDAT